jgi:hypothetical protein
VGQSETRKRRKRSRPTGILQAGYRDASQVGGRERRKRRNGPLVGILFLVRANFRYLRSQMRGFHDLLRYKPPSQKLHNLYSHQIL